MAEIMVFAATHYEVFNNFNSSSNEQNLGAGQLVFFVSLVLWFFHIAQHGVRAKINDICFFETLQRSSFWSSSERV